MKLNRPALPPAVAHLVLVRPSNSAMKVGCAIGLALIHIGCASQSSPIVSGRFPLTEADFSAIQRVIQSHPDIAKPIRSIYTDRPDHAQVSSGELTRRVGSGSLFTVAKRRGEWVIDPPV